MTALLVVAACALGFTVLVFAGIGVGTYLKAHGRPADKRSPRD